jgi:pimeloyl-ACP methyl ester carboxylesterase
MTAPQSFTHGGFRLDFTEFGSGDDVVVLLHGQLIPRRMHDPLAAALADAGYRAVTLDLLGHGTSERPTDSWCYSMTAWGEQVLGLLDHLGVTEAFVGGTSLGANVSLEVAVAAPQRLRGLLLEMPVLDNALVAGLVAFAPLMLTARFLPSVIRAQSWLAGQALRACPTDSPTGFWTSILLETMRQEPAAMAAAIAGVFFGRVAPQRSLRRDIDVPALVIGHRRDPIHPFADAGMLVDEMPNARLVEADSPLELRFAPDRLVTEIVTFLDELRDRPAAPTGIVDNSITL